MTKNCKQCGEGFQKRLTCSIKQWNTVRKFCSSKCFFSWRSTNAKENGPLSYRKRKPTLHTYIKIKRGHPKGKDHYNWQGGITSLNHGVRNLDRYTEWRMGIFTRDGFCCVQCKSKEQIQADHIISLAALLKIFEIRTAEEARTCTFLWDLSNGRTLCVPCHTQTETYGGRGNKNSQEYVKTLLEKN